MMSFLHDDDLLMGQLLAPDSIVLTPEQIDWAIELSHHAASEAEQWQTYLNGLALQGLQEWLQKRSPELALISDWLSESIPAQLNLTQTSPAQLNSTQPNPSRPVAAASVAQSVCQVQVGSSALYLLTTDGLGDAWVTVPPPQLTSTQNPAEQNPVEQNLVEPAQPDFYVLVEILEELAEVRVQGYLSRASLQAQITEFQHFNPEAAQPANAQLQEPAEPIELPLQAFSLDPDALLLHLRTGFQLDSALVQSPVQAASGEPVANPALVTSSVTSSLSSPPLINVGLWLNNQLDAVAKALAWVLIPPAAVELSGALRGQSDRGDLNLVIRNLRRDRALVIPADARAACHDVTLEGLAARLYILIWVAADQAEWSMLLILGAQPGFPLPTGLRLQVAAAGQVLSDERLEQEPYLYVQVVGDWNEQFQVTLVAPNGRTLALPILALVPAEPA